MSSPSKTFREMRPVPPGPKPGRAEPPSPPKSEGKPAQPDEIGGPTGLEPTRYGDWERGGRCTDF